MTDTFARQFLTIIAKNNIL